MKQNQITFFPNNLKGSVLEKSDPKAYQLLRKKDSQLYILLDAKLTNNVVFGNVQEFINLYQLFVPANTNLYEGITIPAELSTDGQVHQVNTKEEFERYYDVDKDNELTKQHRVLVEQQQFKERSGNPGLFFLYKRKNHLILRWYLELNYDIISLSHIFRRIKMDIQREKEFVSQYHYDARNFEWEKENGIPETKVDVNFQLINRDQEQNTTSLIVILSYMIVFDGFVISGTITQINHLFGRYVNEPSEFSKDEVEELARPCLNMLNRLTYEVTEIALDLPGINLEF